MNNVLTKLLMWSEVWALLIPLAIVIIYKIKGRQVRPIILYIVIGLLLNLAATLISVYRMRLPASLQNNNILYNIHSVLRVIFFGWYVYNLQLIRSTWFPKLVLPVYFLFVLINFTIWEDPLFLSTRLLSAESIVLLALCLFFLISSIRDDSEINWLKHPSFLICTGLCFYEAVNFFIFLFFYPLLEKNLEFGMLTMKIFSVSFIIFCVIIALALYRSRKKIKAA